MEDVKWGEFFFGGFLAVISLLLPSAVVYFVLSALGVSSVWDVSTFNLAVIAVGLVGIVLIARIYPGRDRLLEHGWLFALIMIGLPIALLAFYLAGGMSADSAANLAAAICTQLVSILFFLLFILYIHAREATVSLTNESKESSEYSRIRAPLK